jgi:L(+)-tartrate dehydratase beta subunit
MAHHDLHLPVTESQARALRIDDTVTLQGRLFGIRDATQIALFDRGRTTRLDLQGHAVIHTAPNVARVAPSTQHPTGYAPICVGTTTSMRMERFTRPLMQTLGARLVIGKGGLGADSLAAFREFGGAYLAIIGGYRGARDHVDRGHRGRRSRRSQS